MSEKSFVSVVIPCLRERMHIGAALDSVVAQDYPKERLEVLVVDGMSEDGTREIVEEFSQRYPFIQLLDNPKRITPAPLNVGIQNARGEIVVRMDAHTTYEADYVSRCEKALRENDVDVVGGVLQVVPDKDTFVGRAIALTQSDSFGVGNAYHKVGHATEQRQVDTVPFGSYRRTLFNQIGLFDEGLPRSEDADFHLRVKAAGGEILLVPSIVSHYRVRSTFAAFSKHSLHNGYLVTYFLKNGSRAFFWRHLVPLAFVSSVLISDALALFYPIFLWPLATVLSVYFLVNAVASFRVAIRQRTFAIW